jgi:probable F420-dependent oxidoreductase
VRFTVTYPMVVQPYDPALLTKEALVRFATTAEAAGFDGMGFTDHPAPTDRWLKAGGHDALDPFVALAMCAAVTDRLRLIPNIVVLPYRHPLIVAKTVATLDALSGGRFTLAAATGYLRGEYRALGIDFEQRNQLFDQALEVLRGIWTTEDFTYTGVGIDAVGQTANPRPDPLPPIWIGGNSRLSRRRVATVADGWAPFPAPAALSQTTKTPPLETVDDLRPMLEELWAWTEEAGRDPAVLDVTFRTPAGGDPSRDHFDGAAHLEGLEELAALGVTWASVGVPGDSLERALETLERYGREVIAPHRAG